MLLASLTSHDFELKWKLFLPLSRPKQRASECKTCGNKQVTVQKKGYNSLLKTEWHGMNGSFIIHKIDKIWHLIMYYNKGPTDGMAA